MTKGMSLRTLTMKNTTADVTVAQNTGAKPGVMSVETKIKEIEIDITMRKESMMLTLEIPTTEAGPP